MSAAAQLGVDDMSAITVQNVTHRYGSTVALDRCSLEIERGQFVSLLGPSGCGKTTLLRIIGGFLRQAEGGVRIMGTLVDDQPPNRRNVNTVFQSYALFSHMTVFDNIAFPLTMQGVRGDERRRRVRDVLELVRLPDVGERRADQLSGGQAQRIALARALVGRPAVLLLDEPLAALDLKLRKAMQLELRRIHDELGTTFLYVTHDQEEALTMSDRIVLMQDGRIVQDGSPKDIYDHPATIFASTFIGEANLIDAVVTARRPEGSLLAVGGIQLAATATSLPDGSSVVASIRPESIAIGGSGQNSVSGRVMRVTFLGPLVRATVEVAPGVTLNVAATRDAASALVVDAIVPLAFEASAVNVLPAE